MSKADMMSNLTKAVFDDFNWITNFFPIQDQVYVSDSNFNNSKNFLCRIEKKVLLEEVKIKKTWNRYFLAHPNPLESSLAASSQTDLKICLSSEDFIQNVIFYDFSYFITFVKKTDQEAVTYTNQYNGDFEFIKQVNDLNDVIFISPIMQKDWIFIKENTTLKTFKLNLKTQEKIAINYNLKKVVLLQDKIAALREDFKVFTADLDFSNPEIYEDTIFEKQIASFSEEAFLISDKENGKTYCCFLNEQKTKKKIIGKYFYRLESYERELIIGKPLIDAFGGINYYQAPWFIY